MDLGDDNRAIDDFDFVISLEPDNILAIFNRAILLDKTGNLRAAIRDYSRVIDEFPNFWNGLYRRAECYRKLGMTAKAEMDEFRILKAQLDKRQGKQQRWSKDKLKQVRSRSETAPDKYNQMVVADEATPEREYKSDYRGHVQNHAATLDPQPMFCLSLEQHKGGVRTYHAFSPAVESFNIDYQGRRVYVSSHHGRMDEAQSRQTLDYIDSLSQHVNATRKEVDLYPLLMRRAVAETVAMNYDAAISDLTTCLSIRPSSAMALWQRAYCQMRIDDFDRGNDGSHGAESVTSLPLRHDNVLKYAAVLRDLDAAIVLDPTNQYLIYNRGNARLMRKDYANAIDDYTHALSIDPSLAEAYYNRGLAHIGEGNKQQGVSDLSKAGELGLYNAYSVIKTVRKKDN